MRRQRDAGKTLWDADKNSSRGGSDSNDDYVHGEKPKRRNHADADRVLNKILDFLDDHGDRLPTREDKDRVFNFIL